MRRIDKKYAIIYIDNDGETLKTDDYFTDAMTTDYYKSPGTSQWNFYVLIPKDLVNESDIEKIEANMTYARKYVIDRKIIDAYVEENFPDLREKMGKVKLIKGENWSDAQIKMNDFWNEQNDKNIYWLPVDSFYREHSILDTLMLLDMKRTQLITDPEYRIVFHTHINLEYNLAKQKVEIFQ